MFTEGVGVEQQSVSGPDFGLLRSIIPLRPRPTYPYHVALLCAFVSSSRVLSCQAELSDVTELSHVKSEERTVAADFGLDGSVLVQVTSGGVRMVSVNGAERTADRIFAGSSVALEWDVDALGAATRVVHAAVLDDRVLLGVLPSPRLVLCGITFLDLQPGAEPTVVLTVLAQLPLAAELSCLCLFHVDGGFASEDHVLVCAVGTHACSLDVYAIASPTPQQPPSFFALLTASLSGFNHSVVESCMDCAEGGLLLVGLREGLLLQFLVEWPPSPFSLSPVALPEPVVHRFGILSVQLCRAPTWLYGDGSFLALSERLMMLLPSSLSTSALTPLPVATGTRYTYAVHFSSPGFPDGSILAVADARLHLLSILPPTRRGLPCGLVSTARWPFHSVTIPLPGTPRRVLYHSPSQLVVVALASDSHCPLLLVDPSWRPGSGQGTGYTEAAEQMCDPGERISSLSSLAVLRLPGPMEVLVVGFSSHIPLTGKTRGALQLYHIQHSGTHSISITARAELYSPRAHLLHLATITVGSEAPAVLRAHASGVLCAVGSAVKLIAYYADRGSPLQCVVRAQVELNNRVMDIDLDGDVVLVSVYNDGVRVLQIDGEDGSVSMRVVAVIDPRSLARRGACAFCSPSPR